MALRYCAAPGCSALVPSGRCATHTKTARAYTDRHHTGETAYTSAKWLRVSRAFRAAHPFCVNAHDARYPRCTLVTEAVDHIVPHRGDARLFWAESNMQPMCKACHSAKTAREINEGAA